MNEAEDTITSLEDIIQNLLMLVNLTDDESNFDGSDSEYDNGWLLIDPMDPAHPTGRRD